MTYTPAIEVMGVGTTITHNLIEQSPGSGILIYGNEHLIEKNEVHHVCEEASDCGAIYSGRDWTFRGNVIRFNSIHDLFGYGLKSVDLANNRVEYKKPDGVRGVYLDDSVSGFSVIGNLFYNAGLMSIQLGSGRDNAIENNIISTDQFALVMDHRTPGPELKKRLSQVPIQSGPWASKYPKLAEPMHNENWPEGNSIQRNIIISSKPDGLSLVYMLPKQTNTLANNLIWSSKGQFRIRYKILDGAGKSNEAPWQEWINEGIESGSIASDPCLIIRGNQTALCQQSQAKAIGFQALPSDIGLIE
jgi:parallel beta-helix repeat protein